MSGAVVILKSIRSLT